MSFFSNLWHRAYATILDNRNKLTATGGLLLGIILTLGFKDLYPDLEQAFRQRLRRVRGQDLPHPLPGQSDYVRLEDHTKRRSSFLTTDATDSRRTQEHDTAVGIEGLIGNTPLIKLKSLSEATGCEILAKAEYLNGAGNSPKDRVALSMIDHAEEEGLIKPHRGDTIYEGTVGSTGISLAAVCRARGYKAYMYVAPQFCSERTKSNFPIAACLMISRRKSLISFSSSVQLSKE
jgi:cysteine synthase